MKEIERIIGKKFESGAMPSNKEICEKQLLKVIDDVEKVKVNEEEIADYMPAIYRKLEWLDKEDIIKRMVSLEFNRFLEYYRNREEIETPSDQGRQKEAKGGKSERGGSRQAEHGYTRLFINQGKADDLFPAQLIDLINKHTKKRVNLGRIDLMKSFSFFEVEENQTDMVVKALNRASFNGRKVIVEVAGEESDGGWKNKKKSGGGTSKGYGNNSNKGYGKPSRKERGYANARGPKGKK